MNLDLLKKLTRLANNNPNENEANLAARKVCKMLEAGNWLLPAAPVVKTAAEKVKTWADVKRSTEPAWRSKPPEPTEESNRRQTEWFNEFFRNMTDEQKRRWDNFREGSWDRPPRNVRFDPADYPFTDSKKKSAAYSERPKRMLKCTKCGVEKETGYVGNLYICTDCYWKEYNEKRGEATG